MLPFTPAPAASIAYQILGSGRRLHMLFCAVVVVILCYRRRVSDTRHHATARGLPHRMSRDGDLLRQAASWRFCCWLQSSMDHVLVSVGNARRPCRPRMCCCCCSIHPTLSHTLSFDRPRTPMRQAHARVRPA